MIAVPMSGDAHTDDPDGVIVWWFAVPGLSSCTISVHVPRTGNVRMATRGIDWGPGREGAHLGVSAVPVTC
jgi:hypothetical protein